MVDEEVRRPLLELELEYSRGIVGVGGWLVFGLDCRRRWDQIVKLGRDESGW